MRIVIIFILFIMALCIGQYTGVISKYGEDLLDKVETINDPYNKVVKFNYEGHDYIDFMTNGHPNIVHDPNCTYCKNIN